MLLVEKKIVIPKLKLKIVIIIQVLNKTRKYKFVDKAIAGSFMNVKFFLFIHDLVIVNGIKLENLDAKYHNLISFHRYRKKFYDIKVQNVSKLKKNKLQ